MRLLLRNEMRALKVTGGSGRDGRLLSSRATRAAGARAGAIVPVCAPFAAQSHRHRSGDEARVQEAEAARMRATGRPGAGAWKKREMNATLPPGQNAAPGLGSDDRIRDAHQESYRKSQREN